MAHHSGMSTSSRTLFSLAVSLTLATTGPSAASAFGYDADMQCTNGQLDYSCQKGTRCPSRKQGGKGTDCIDSDSGTSGKCTSYRVCTDMNQDHKRVSKKTLSEATDWGGLGEGVLGQMDSSIDFDGLQLSTDLPGGGDVSPFGINSTAGANSFGEAFDSAFDTSPDAPPGNAVSSFQQENGVATMIDSMSPPFGDVPPPIPLKYGPQAEAAVLSTPDDVASLSPQQNQSGAQGASQGQGGGMPSLPGMGGGSGGGGKGQQAQTGFSPAPTDAHKKTEVPAYAWVGSQLGQLWDWLTGKPDAPVDTSPAPTNSAAAQHTPVAIPI